jgi:antirestriction protein ArdC
VTRQEGPNRSSHSGRERKRKAGMGRLVQAAREAPPAGRGDSLMSHTSASTRRGDVYSRITAEIVAAIERGAGEWRAPWFHNGASVARPTNVASGKRYRGINTLALWAAGLAAEYGDGLWGTYKQWQEAGAQVRQGERSTTVVLWREIPSSRQPNDDDDDDDGHRRMFARAFSVFNVAQVDGYQRPATDILSESQRLAHAEAFISNLGVKTVFGGSEACHRPLTDAVFMPPFASFRDPASFYGVWLHENGHASGAKHRLDRDLSGRFGSAAYAAEECGKSPERTLVSMRSSSTATESPPESTTAPSSFSPVPGSTGPSSILQPPPHSQSLKSNPAISTVSSAAFARMA